MSTLSQHASPSASIESAACAPSSHPGTVNDMPSTVTASGAGSPNSCFASATASGSPPGVASNVAASSGGALRARCRGAGIGPGVLEHRQRIDDDDVVQLTLLRRIGVPRHEGQFGPGLKVEGTGLQRFAMRLSHHCVMLKSSCLRCFDLAPDARLVVQRRVRRRCAAHSCTLLQQRFVSRERRDSGSMRPLVDESCAGGVSAPGARSAAIRVASVFPSSTPH